MDNDTNQPINPTSVEALDVFAEFATDENAEDNGTWFPYRNSRFLVARSGNRAYTRKLNELVDSRRLDLLNPDQAVAQKASDEVMIEVIAETLLKGWEGVAYKKKVLEFSPQNARVLLAHRDFRRLISSMADEKSAFMAKEEAEQGEA